MESPTLHITRREHGDVSVLAPSGRITLGQNVRFLKETLEELANAGQRSVVLDMADVPYLDSAGLGTIMTGSNLFKQNGGALVLSGVQPRIAQLLELTRVTEVLKTFPNEAAAVEGVVQLS